MSKVLLQELCNGNWDYWRLRSGAQYFSTKLGTWIFKIQPKLLKILEEKRFRRLGDVQERQLDIRLIAASHQDLSELIRQKKFRSDLYFRVSTVTIRVPTLRERAEDIPLLARCFLERAAVDFGKPPSGISEHAINRLTSYSWPGNIRELKNVIERAVLLTSGETIQPRDLHLEFAEKPTSNGEDSTLTLREMQHRHIQRALTAEKGNIARTAERLGITRSALYSKIKTFGINQFKH